MYKDFGKDELFSMFFPCISAILYRISENYKINIISFKIVLIISMISAAYLCFNRVIKLMIDVAINKNNFYDTVFTIQDIRYKQVRNGRYEVYIVKYNDADNNAHIKEIHSSFSIKKWKIGDEIKIKVSTIDPDTIVIVFSDIAMAVIMSIMGIIFETILIIAYIHAH